MIESLDQLAFRVGWIIMYIAFVCALMGLLSGITILCWNYIIGPFLKNMRVWVWLFRYVAYRHEIHEWLKNKKHDKN